MATKKEATKKEEKSLPNGYAARLDIDYPEKLNRVTTFFRLLWIIPIAIILTLITGSGETVTNTVFLNEAGEMIRRTQETAGGMAMGIPAAVALMIIFKQVYPRWWFDFLSELTRFEARVGAYAALMTDQYPSTVEEQSVHLELIYPNVEKDLNRLMPLFKWFLAIPHYIVLAFLSIAGMFVVVFAWFAILFTGKYPKGLFDFNVGIMRWWMRVNAYVALQLTDTYPPFSLN
jgi:hypothetical protein